MSIEEKIKLDYSMIGDVQVDGVDTSDYPDFCDAYICYASYGDRDMSEDELEVLNEDRDFVYDETIKVVF